MDCLTNRKFISLIGAIQRRQGKWAESTANLEKAASLNPKDVWALQNLTFNYQMLRNWDAANKTIDRAIALDPTALDPLEVKCQLAVAEKGDFSVTEKAFDAVKSVPMSADQRAQDRQFPGGCVSPRTQV